MEFFKKQRTLIDLMKTKHVATFVFVSIAALFLAEFVLRGLVLLMPVETDLVFGTLPKVGIATDVKGFPNKEVLMTANIVVFGDSMTIGPTVTRLESWPQVVAKLATTSVYSMAVGGYGPVQYAAQLDQALLLRPKVVVVGFYFASDMIDAYTMAYENEYWKSLRDPAFVSARIPTAGRDCGTSVGSQSVQLHCSIAKWNTWLKAKLRVYLRLGDITRGLRVTGSAFIEKKSANTIVMVNDPRMGTVGISTEHQHLFDISEPSVREGWRITRMLFTGMKKRAAGHGARFVVVIIPTKVELYAEYYKAKGEEIPDVLFEYAAVLARTHDEIRRYCREEYIECVDVLPDFVSALLDGRRMYADNPEEGHPISGGYSVLGEAVAAYLEK